MGKFYNRDSIQIRFSIILWVLCKVDCGIHTTCHAVKTEKEIPHDHGASIVLTSFPFHSSVKNNFTAPCPLRGLGLNPKVTDKMSC